MYEEERRGEGRAWEERGGGEGMEEGGRRGEEVKERRWVESEGGGAPFYRRRFARCRGARPSDGLFFADVSPRPTVLACADRALTGPGRKGWNAHSTVAVGACTTVQARGNRMRLSALRAHTKVPYKPISYGKRLGRLTAPGRPGPCRSAAAPARRPLGHLHVAARRSAPRPSASHRGGQSSRRPAIAAAGSAF